MLNVQSINRFVTRFGTQRRQTEKFTKAVHMVYARWATRYPQWANAFFDQYFLAQHTERLLTRYGEGRLGEEAAVLANQWAQQFRFNPSRREQLVREVTPAATNFLRLLKVELCLQAKYERQARGTWPFSIWAKRGQPL